MLVWIALKDCGLHDWSASGRTVSLALDESCFASSQQEITVSEGGREI
jgi:hypothetical protein